MENRTDSKSYSLKLRTGTSVLFNKAFFTVFFFIFAACLTGGQFAVSFFGELGDMSPGTGEAVMRFVFMLASFLCLTVLLLFLCRTFISSRLEFTDDDRNYYAIVFISLAVILAVQLFCIYCLRMIPKTDVESVENYAKKIIQDNSFDCIREEYNDNYIIRYQNNILYMFIITGIYKLTYALSGTFSRLPLLLINALAINFSIFVTILISKKALDKRKSLYTLVLCVLFTPYYTYSPYYYTDTFSLPFAAGAVYSFICAAKTNEKKKKVLLFLLCGILCCIGFKIKGSIIIFFIAFIIYLFVKYSPKKALKCALCVILAFTVVFSSFSLILKSTDIIPEELSDKYRYPSVHWIMMGLKGVGGYDYEDSTFTKSFESTEDMKEADINEIKSRIDKMGFFGLAGHLIRKAVWTWEDGTYYIVYYLEQYVHRSFMHELILFDGNLRFLYYTLSSSLQLFLILMMALSAFKAGKKRTTDILIMLRISATGCLIFFLIWETNTRYLFVFSTMFLILATDGAFEITDHILKSRIDITQKTLRRNI